LADFIMNAVTRHDNHTFQLTCKLQLNKV